MTDQAPVTPDEETAFLDRMARVMRDYADREYPYGIMRGWDDIRKALNEIRPELHHYAYRAINHHKEQAE